MQDRIPKPEQFHRYLLFAWTDCLECPGYTQQVANYETIAELNHFLSTQDYSSYIDWTVLDLVGRRWLTGSEFNAPKEPAYPPAKQSPIKTFVGWR